MVPLNSASFHPISLPDKLCLPLLADAQLERVSQRTQTETDRNEPSPQTVLSKTAPTEI